MKWLAIGLFVVSCGLAFGQAPKANLVLQAPISRWDEAIPLGNGFTGALLWGERNLIRVSLDRGDIWDLRPAPELADPGWNYANMKRLVAEKNQVEISRLFDACYEQHPYPTKLPIGRLEIKLPEKYQAQNFSLSLANALGTVDYGIGKALAFSPATGKYEFRMELSCPPESFTLLPPAGVKQLGYNFTEHKEPQFVAVFVKTSGEPYVVCAKWSQVVSKTFVTAAILRLKEEDWVNQAKKELDQLESKNWADQLANHEKWWKSFWQASQISIPEKKLQFHYDLVKYYYGAASRSGAPAIPLQGVWTADEGGLPPWKGDYHNDLNTQTTYIAYPTAGLYESGSSWIEMNMALLPRYRRFAKEFYGVDGAVIPGVMTLNGDPMGGWGMYSLSPTNGAWVAQQFIRHWRFTNSNSFLKSKAYPFCKEIGVALKSLLIEDSSGRLKLALSSSPEIHDNSLRAWLTPNSNYDHAMLRYLFTELVLMARELKLSTEEKSWKDTLSKLGPYVVDDTGLMFAKDEPVKGSHRHFSHLMAVHPLGDLSIEGSDTEEEIVRKSVAHMLKQGTDWWTGYSFSWMATMLARIREPELALDNLRKYEKGFILRNGFHCNGDQSGTGMSKFTYRPFTLEGNFLAMEAIHEMLLQSWGGIVRVFPSVSKEWADVSFTDLRAEGGFKVSAIRKKGETVWVKITATVDEDLVLLQPFDGAAKWIGPKFRVDESTIRVKLKTGESLSGRLQ